jgi:hypothetical protein
MKAIDDPIDKLRELDLSNYPIDEITAIMQNFGRYGVIKMTLKEGMTIIRARPNEPNETFKTVTDLSFKPAEFNTKYQRASTPLTTMFYGCVVPENIAEGEIDDPRIPAIYEVSKLYRQEIENGEEKITFSYWIVTKDIPLVAIVYHKHFIDNSTHTRELYSAYQSFLQSNPSDITNSNAMTEFLAGEFAKSKIQKEYDYLISALYTELVVQQGYAGVYYPSVRLDGEGFNVAIDPSIVESCMLLIGACECSLYKKGQDIVLDNDTITNIDFGQTDFIFEPNTDPEFHSGREICYKILNGEIRL